MWLERVTFLATTIGIICGVVVANPIGVDDGDSVRDLLATKHFGIPYSLHYKTNIFPVCETVFECVPLFPCRPPVYSILHYSVNSSV